MNVKMLEDGYMFLLNIWLITLPCSKDRVQLELTITWRYCHFFIILG